MLSSSRWTVIDLFLMVALVSLAARVFSFDAQVVRAQDRAQTRLVALTDTLSVPIPNPATAASMGRVVQLDVTLRCIGLAEFRRMQSCQVAEGTQCSRAEIAVRDIESSLWPKGRVGQFAMAFRNRADVYAKAYATLGERGAASSELILGRDSAMCRRYHSTPEARLHEPEFRQPG